MGSCCQLTIRMSVSKLSRDCQPQRLVNPSEAGNDANAVVEPRESTTEQGTLPHHIQKFKSITFHLCEHSSIDPLIL